MLPMKESNWPMCGDGVERLMMGSDYEPHASRMSGRTRSFISFRPGIALSSFRSAISHHTPGKGVSQKGGRESKPPWSETEGQAFRFPRPSRLVGRGFPPSTDQFRVGQPPSDNLANSKVEPIRVAHVLPVVKA